MMKKEFYLAIENFIYKRIVKSLMFSSRLGRWVTFGYADSGINFDHIYQNKAKGYNRFGILMDRILLSLPACKATRERFKVIRKVVTDEISHNCDLGIKTRIVDLASGPARYLIETMSDRSREEVEGLCLDIDRRSLNYGKKLAHNKPVLFRRANALWLGKHLHRLSAKTKWVPNLVIASGFYEYHPDDVVQTHFRKVHEHLDSNGLFFGILQFKNPNRKLIEKVGYQKSGKEWILYYRSPDVLESWLKRAGYGDIRVFSDRWNQYIFCLGRKKSKGTVREKK